MTKRKISNKIDKLEEETGSFDSELLLMNMTHIEIPEDKRWPEIEDSPHRDLTIKPWPEQKPHSLKIAVPNVIPEEYQRYRTVIVITCDGSKSVDRDNNNADSGTLVVPACELWDSMTEEQLQQEYKHRKEHDEPVPELLGDYE